MLSSVPLLAAAAAFALFIYLICVQVSSIVISLPCLNIPIIWLRRWFSYFVHFALILLFLSLSLSVSSSACAEKFLQCDENSLFCFSIEYVCTFYVLSIKLETEKKQKKTETGSLSQFAFKH